MTPKLPWFKRNADSSRRWPGYLFGGHLRTSTVVLMLVFGAAAWIYDAHQPEKAEPEAPQVVPPGFIPDPNYTWVPRTRLQQPPVTVTKTFTPPTVTETVTPLPPPEPTPEPNQWPFCPPICPPSPPPPPPEAPPGAPAPPTGAGGPGGPTPPSTTPAPGLAPAPVPGAPATPTPRP